MTEHRLFTETMQLRSLNCKDGAPAPKGMWPWTSCLHFMIQAPGRGCGCDDSAVFKRRTWGSERPAQGRKAKGTTDGGLHAHFLSSLIGFGHGTMHEGPSRTAARLASC